MAEKTELAYKTLRPKKGSTQDTRTLMAKTSTKKETTELSPKSREEARKGKDVDVDDEEYCTSDDESDLSDRDFSVDMKESDIELLEAEMTEAKPELVKDGSGNEWKLYCFPLDERPKLGYIDDTPSSSEGEEDVPLSREDLIKKYNLRDL